MTSVADEPLLPPGLSDAQRTAIVANDPLLCVLAGAGAGKTRVLTLRVARRIVDGEVEPQHVLVCTFSRKAADELRRRLWVLDVPEGVRAGTFHRTALALLRQQRADRRLAPPEVVADRGALLASVLGVAHGPAAAEGSLRGAGGPKGGSGRTAGRTAGVGRVEAEISWAKARLIAPERYEEEAARHGRRPGLGRARVATLYGDYEAALRARGLLDLDDLLIACADMLTSDPAFADAVRWRFRHLFVDEMQDVNPAQFRLLTSLLGNHPDLFVVGDPNQSVYGWNGADPTLLRHLPEVLPGTRVIRLDDNHRCSPQVVTLASAVLGLEAADAPRSTRPDGPIPVVTGHATDREEAKWVAHQAWLAHRPGRRWSQIAVLARTNAQLTAVADALREARIPVVVAGRDLGPASDLRDPAQGDDPYRLRPVPDPAGAEGRPWDGGGEENVAPWYEDRQGAVMLTTFHRAKGLQWAAVFVIGLSQGLVPLGSARTGEALDEERRLLYVALTRAEGELFCSWAQAAGSSSGADPERRPRRPSPWLDDLRRAREDLASAEPDPSLAVARLAELRAQLAAVVPGDR